MFYDRFVEICKHHNVSPSQVAIRCGFNKSSITSWKKNGYTPRQEILIKIADYFNVTVDFLLGNQQNESTVISDEDIKTALFGGDKPVSDEMWDEVKSYVEYLKTKYQNN